MDRRPPGSMRVRITHDQSSSAPQSWPRPERPPSAFGVAENGRVRRRRQQTLARLEGCSAGTRVHVVGASVRLVRGECPDLQLQGLRPGVHDRRVGVVPVSPGNLVRCPKSAHLDSWLITVATRRPLVGRRDQIDMVAIALEQPRRQTFTTHSPFGGSAIPPGSAAEVQLTVFTNRRISAAHASGSSTTQAWPSVASTTSCDDPTRRYERWSPIFRGGDELAFTSAVEAAVHSPPRPPPPSRRQGARSRP
jgi:hypothetical protein